MNILLDECVDRRLARELVGHAVTTVSRRGWSGIKNGDLLAIAEQELDVFITVDRKLAEQHHLPGFELAVILLRAPSNRLEDIRPLAPTILEQVVQAPTGALTVIGG